MINVMQLVQHFKVGGLEKMVFELRRKSIHNATTHVVALEESSQAWPELATLPNLCSLNKQAGIQPKVITQLVEYIDKHDIRIIHSHHIGPMLYAALAIVQRPHVKHVTTVHDAWYLQQWRMRLITWAICKFTNVNVVADAQAVAQEVAQKVHHQANDVVINGIDSVYFSPINQQFARYQLSLPQNVRLIGCGARVESGKGHQAMISQLHLLPNDIHLVFAGDGGLKADLIVLAQTLGVAHRIHWLGRISKMQVFYSAIDVFCLFSEREGLPLALLEAMACNRPVVASDVGGVKEVVNPDAGIVLDKDDIEKLAPALLQAFALKENNIRGNNLGLVCSSLMAKRYDAIYQTLCV
ncbi:glycosyltransferase [Pseudoalteromonas tunicata]|uniref:glycosyltransferase n=1 Tax=Pseudoalteromonas tunicata TaxID=314281 RepID=UPI00273D1425|nr:glycosyltransferase [Pseudoalteromonas tunicata]MDP4985544.1 glycosyltransferase [Pseudoalteromonas tunicata]